MFGQLSSEEERATPYLVLQRISYVQYGMQKYCFCSQHVFSQTERFSCLLVLYLPYQMNNLFNQRYISSLCLICEVFIDENSNIVIALLYGWASSQSAD